MKKSTAKPSADQATHGTGSRAGHSGIFSTTHQLALESFAVRDSPPQFVPSEGGIPTPSPSHPVLRMQRELGNRAVARWLGSPRFQAKLHITQPGDMYEREADRVAEAVVRGQMATATLRTGAFVQRDEAPSPPNERQQLVEPPKETGRLTPEDIARISTGKPPPSQSDELKKAAEKTTEALRKTKIGKELEEKATELGKDFVSTLEGKVVTGTAVAGALTGLIAADASLPVQPPEIPLDWLASGLKGKLSWEGPVRHPTKVFLTFTFTPGAGEKKKPHQTEADKYRAEAARIAADLETFKRHMTYTLGSREDLEQKAQDEAFQRWATSRLGLAPSPAGDALQSAPRLSTFTDDAWQQAWKNYFQEKRHPSVLSGELHLEPITPPMTPTTGGADQPTQRKESDSATSPGQAPAVVDAALRSPGHALDAETRRAMEGRLGHDFSNVRIHTDAVAAESAKAVHAHAYTVGRDIVFGAGQYAPMSTVGARLLAHELAHTVQQGVTGRALARQSVEGYETKGIGLDVTEMNKWTGSSFWEQKVMKTWELTTDPRMNANPEERDAVLSVLSNVQPKLPLSAETTRLVTIPKRAAASTSKDLIYLLTFKPKARGKPSAEAAFVAEGGAATVSAATAPPPGLTPNWPALTHSGFPGGNFHAYWTAHPDEEKQVFNWIQNTAGNTFDQVITTSVTTKVGKKSVTRETSFQVQGSKAASGSITSLTVRFLGAVLPSKLSPPADYSQKDFADLEIEEAQTKNDPKKGDKLGTVNGLSSVPSGEQLSVKFAIWQYFRGGTRNAEVDAIVPIANTTKRVLYTLRFRPRSNNVDVERIGEEGKDVSLASPPLSLSHVNGFAGNSKDVPTLKAWLSKRYPAIKPTGTSVDDIRKAADAQIQADAGTPAWFMNNYGIEILDDVAGAARLQTKHNFRAAQVVDMKVFTADELKLLESVLETVSDTTLAGFKDIRMVRQAVAIETVGKTFRHNRERTGLSNLNGADRTIIIYDSAHLNDAALFLGGRGPGGALAVEPSAGMTFAHEFGHTVSWGHGVQSAFDAFVAQKRITPPTWYAAGSPASEMFPETFALFQLDPEWMRTNQPDLFAWFDTLTKTGAPPAATPPTHGATGSKPVQRKETHPTPPAYGVPPSLPAVLRSPGMPLETGTRFLMERHIGHDFRGVRIHVDAVAAQSAASAQAHAYTVGRDIVFGAGRYSPSTTEGVRLLAHELTHVVQQQQMPVPLIQRQKAAPANDRDQKIAAFRGYVKKGDWKPAALHLNGFSEEDIGRLLNEVNHDARTGLYAGALESMPGYSERVTNAIAQIDKEAVRVGQLIFDYDAAVGKGDWPKAAEILSAFSDPDIRSRLDELSPSDLDAMRGAAKGRFGRVAGPAEAVAQSRALAEGLEKIRHIRGSTSVQDAVKKIQEALKGVNLRNRQNLTAIINVIGTTFGRDSGPILEGFLSEVEASLAPRQPTQAEVAREQQVESLMQTGPRGPYKQYGVGVVLPVVTQPARHLLPAVEAAGNAFEGAGAFIQGLLSGLSGSLDDAHRERLKTRLLQSTILTTVFPVIFLAGTAVGVVEDVVDAVKGIYQAVSNFGQFVDAIVTFTKAILSPDSAAIGHAVGEEMGKDYGKKIAGMADEGVFRFTYDLGRMIGPTILYIVLSFLGVPELIAAEILDRLLPILRPLLEKFPRLLKLMESLAAKMKERKAATMLGKALEKRAAEKAAGSALEALLKKIPAALGGGEFKWVSFEEAIAKNIATEGMGLADVMSALGTGNPEVRRLFRIAYSGLNDKKIWESVLADIAREAENEGASTFSHPQITSKYTQAIWNLSRKKATSQIVVVTPETKFFGPQVPFGSRFLDLGAPHGASAHMVQDLVIDRALQQAGESADAEALRRMMGGVQGSYRTAELRNLLWNALYDANESQGRLNAPEKVDELLKTVFGKVD